MRHLVTAFALAGALLSSAPIFGQRPPPMEALPPPPIPDRIDEGESLEPEVTIRTTPRGIVEEYRLHGRLYMIRVVPKRGYPYYLVDADGDGFLETTRDGLAPGFLIPSWVIYRW